jgi:hypothetical protein
MPNICYYDAERLDLEAKAMFENICTFYANIGELAQFCLIVSKPVWKEDKKIGHKICIFGLSVATLASIFT